MKWQHIKVRFTCPECGWEEPAPVPIDLSGGPRADEPAKTRREYLCRNCGFAVPVHLAECWGGISTAEAKKEWLEIYRGLTARNSTRARTRPGAGRSCKAAKRPLSTTRTYLANHNTDPRVA